jgi:hypothetical protein
VTNLFYNPQPIDPNAPFPENEVFVDFMCFDVRVSELLELLPHPCLATLGERTRCAPLPPRANDATKTTAAADCAGSAGNALRTMDRPRTQEIFGHGLSASHWLGVTAGPTFAVYIRHGLTPASLDKCRKDLQASPPANAARRTRRIQTYTDGGSLPWQTKATLWRLSMASSPTR